MEAVRRLIRAIDKEFGETETWQPLILAATRELNDYESRRWQKAWDQLENESKGREATK